MAKCISKALVSNTQIIVPITYTCVYTTLLSYPTDKSPTCAVYEEAERYLEPLELLCRHGREVYRMHCTVRAQQGIGAKRTCHYTYKNHLHIY